MDGETVQAWFIAALRKVLQNLYDPHELRASPLVQVFDVRGDPASGLRGLILDAIQTLQPGGDVPPHAQAWRIYQIVTYRYLEQSSQAVVASNLGLSIRQLRRQERVAESVLADILWNTDDLAARAAQAAAEALGATPESTATGDEPGEDREAELAWLQRSLPSEIVHPGAVIAHALRIIAPLARQLNVAITSDVQADLPPVVGQESLVRQALLSLLTSAAHAAAGGQVDITAAYLDDALCLAVCARPAPAGGATPAVVPAAGVEENLHMAQELVELTGGRLTVDEPAAGELMARLWLPPAEQAPVLAVDDNADTLKLYERYLSGSQYRLIGTPDPRQALPLAEQLDPAAILLDVMLPGMDGWELLGRLREHPLTAGVPVIVCTILPQEQLALALGAAAFIRKPVTREALLAVLDQWTAEASLPGEADSAGADSPVPGRS